MLIKVDSKKKKQTFNHNFDLPYSYIYPKKKLDRMKYFTLLTFSLISLAASSQCQDCGGFRYLQLIFAESEAFEGTVYGENTTIGGQQMELMYDVYDALGDTMSCQGVVIMVHPGITGNYSRTDLADIGHYLAQLGYVAVAVDYRPLDLNLGSGISEEQFFDWAFKASTDVKAAIRFLREFSCCGLTTGDNVYGVNQQDIFVMGIGAGAIVANHTAYLDEGDALPSNLQTIVNANGGWEGNTNSISDFGSEFRAVVSYSGALIDIDWMDNQDPALIAFHDDMDPIIPYESGQLLTEDGINDIGSVMGSSEMVDRAIEVGIYHESHPILNSSEHLSYWDGDNIDVDQSDLMNQFLFDVMCNGVVNSVQAQSASQMEFILHPNPTMDELRIAVNEDLYPQKVIVADLNGQIILDETFQSAIDVAHLSPGTYVVRIEFENNIQSTARLFIKE